MTSREDSGEQLGPHRRRARRPARVGLDPRPGRSAAPLRPRRVQFGQSVAPTEVTARQIEHMRSPDRVLQDDGRGSMPLWIHLRRTASAATRVRASPSQRSRPGQGDADRLVFRGQSVQQQGVRPSSRVWDDDHPPLGSAEPGAGARAMSSPSPVPRSEEAGSDEEVEVAIQYVLVNSRAVDAGAGQRLFGVRPAVADCG